MWYMSIPQSMLLQPTSSDSEPVWVPGPQIRSTIDLVTSCVLTLFLCVWTAIHLNIPGHEERQRRFAFSAIQKKIWWMFVGLIAPEVVLYIAWSQYLYARSIIECLKKIEIKNQRVRTTNQNLGDSRDIDLENGNYMSKVQAVASYNSEKPNRRISMWQHLSKHIYPQELERGFYIAMGGYEILINKHRQIYMTVTAGGAHLLARLGYLPEVTLDTINDKSKADTLTKLLVCTQGSWILIQAAGRKAEGLPITVLEVNTIMHVVCALFMYLLWFKKPQDVRVPLEVKDEIDCKPLAAMLSVSSIQHANITESLLYRKFEEEITKGSMVGCLSALYQRTRVQGLIWEKGGFTYTGRKAATTIGVSEIDTPSGKSNNNTLAMSLDKVAIVIPTEINGYWEIVLVPNTVLDLQSAEFLVKYAFGEIRTVGKNEVWDWEKFVEERQKSVDHGCTKYSSNSIGTGGEMRAGTFNSYIAVIRIIAVSILPAIYGGVHLTPWNDHFPSYLERYLWRLSGLIIACGVIPTIIFFNLDRIWTAFKFSVRFLLKESFQSYCGMLLVDIALSVVSFSMNFIFFMIPLAFAILLMFLLMLYPLARLYITIEAFASLRSLPTDSYTAVQWAELLPHF